MLGLLRPGAAHLAKNGEMWALAVEVQLTPDDLREIESAASKDYRKGPGIPNTLKQMSNR